MNTSAPLLYTNEVPADFLSQLDKSPFTEQQLSTFNEHTFKIVEQRQAYNKTHPPIAIYRVATEGSQTRNGGIIKKTASPLEFTLADGSQVRGAHKDDYVEYADGTQAQIVTGAGEGNSHLALVGSYISNGDQVINTLQDSTLLIARQGIPLAEDFLPAI